MYVASPLQAQSLFLFVSALTPPGTMGRLSTTKCTYLPTYLLRHFSLGCSLPLLLSGVPIVGVAALPMICFFVLYAPPIVELAATIQAALQLIGSSVVTTGKLLR